MLYRLKSINDYKAYLTTNMSEVSGTPAVGQYSFENGILTVNADNTHYFYVNVPVANLRIGDKFRANIDLKLISGTAQPSLITSINPGNGLSGAEGKYRITASADVNQRDFQTLALEAVYEGYEATTSVNPSYNAKGTIYIRFALYEGYGNSHFKIKNFTIENDNNLNGFFPGLRQYYGTLMFSAANKLLSISIDSSHNMHNFAITKTNNDAYSFEINFNQAFLIDPVAIINTSVQVANNKDIELVINTITKTYMRVFFYNKATNTIVNAADINVNIYSFIHIFGE